MIKGSIQEEDITIVNIYAPNIGAPQYVRQMLTAIKGEIDSHTIIVGDFNTPLSPMDRSSKTKINKETQALFIYLFLKINLFIYLFLKINLFIYLFLAVLCLCCCVWVFSSCGEQGLLFVAVRGFLIAVASLRCRAQALDCAGFSSCGARA